MADFYSIAIGLFGFFALCALIVRFTDRGNDARDEHAEHFGIGGDGGSSFIDHYGSASK